MPHGPSDKHKLHFYAAGEGNHFARRQIVLIISLPKTFEQDSVRRLFTAHAAHKAVDRSNAGQLFGVAGAVFAETDNN